MLRQMAILACLILVAGTAKAEISADAGPIDPTNCIYLELIGPNPDLPLRVGENCLYKMKVTNRSKTGTEKT